jgi:hypothetical protein
MAQIVLEKLTMFSRTDSRLQVFQESASIVVNDLNVEQPFDIFCTLDQFRQSLRIQFSEHYGVRRWDHAISMGTNSGIITGIILDSGQAEWEIPLSTARVVSDAHRDTNRIFC